MSSLEEKALILINQGKLNEAEKTIGKCIKIDKNHLKANLTLSALRLHKGDNSLLNKLIQSNHKNNAFHAYSYAARPPLGVILVTPEGIGGRP